ncbi:MAG: hypothetical protein B6I37_08630 [Desulfobacteraceae bacterium 4572_35.2]|nr:MAG: hypothetical protein B6I37_08630 [Desulfobacteraceae bacterium 4572_35.2]
MGWSQCPLQRVEIAKRATNQRETAARGKRPLAADPNCRIIALPINVKQPQGAFCPLRLIQTVE